MLEHERAYKVICFDTSAHLPDWPEGAEDFSTVNIAAQRDAVEGTRKKANTWKILSHQKRIFEKEKRRGSEGEKKENEDRSEIEKQ